MDRKGFEEFCRLFFKAVKPLFDPIQKENKESE